MKLTNLPATKLALVNDTIQTVDFTEGCYGDTLTATVNGEILTDMLEYDDRLDAYSHASDDGSVYYWVIHIFDDENETDFPTKADLMAAMPDATKEFVTMMADGSLDPADLAFSIHLFSSPAFIYKRWKDNGKDILAAQEAIKRDIFDL